MISSLIIKCLNGAENRLQTALDQIEGVEVEKIYNGDVIVLLESTTVEVATRILKKIESLPGVYGAYPVYINMEI